MPQIFDNYFYSFDDEKLHFTQWGDFENAKAIIIALHGMNDYGEAFYLLGPYFAKNNIAIIAYDARGFGRNDNRGYWGGAQSLIGDLNCLIKIMRQKHIGKKIIILGDSMGGSTICAAHFLGQVPQADGIILVAPGVWGTSNQPFYYRIALWIGDKFLRGKKLSPPNIVTRKITPSNNVEMLYKNGRDPNMIWETRPEALKGLVELMEMAFKAAPNLGKIPTLALFAGRDEIIPPSASNKFKARLNKNVKIKDYSNAYHMLLRDLEHEKYFDDILNYIDSIL